MKKENKCAKIIDNNDNTLTFFGVDMKLLFVCHGNICRSPMAEFIFKRILADNGLEKSFTVESRATSADELGSPVYPPAVRELSRHGIDCKGKYAERLTRADYEKYDLIIGMDTANIRNMLRLFGSDHDGKIKKLMDYTTRPGDVDDPWYSGDFALAYRDIFEGCTALLKDILKERKEF